MGCATGRFGWNFLLKGIQKGVGSYEGGFSRMMSGFEPGKGPLHGHSVKPMGVWVDTSISSGAAVSQWVWRHLPFPCQSPLRMRWDFVMATVMFYIVLTVPVRIGFRINDWLSWMAPDLLVCIAMLIHTKRCQVKNVQSEPNYGK